jgi:hypothetical protein
MLIDDVRIRVTAGGAGGKGAVVFNRNLMSLGPVGGSGGKGGNVYVECISNLGALNKFRFNKKNGVNSIFLSSSEYTRQKSFPRAKQSKSPRRRFFGRIIKNMLYKIKPEYFPLIQKPEMCNVTCLQMILFRHGYRFNQDFIAPGIKNNRNYRTVENADKVNDFLRKNKLPFKATSFKASKIINLKEFIVKSIKKNNDLWIELYNPIMY